MSTKTTFYVFVRTDLSLEQQMVQAVHAAAEASRLFYRPEHDIASAIVLAVADKDQLLEAQALVEGFGLKTELFFEPDFDMGYSAFATEPLTDQQRKLLRRWPLWTARRAALEIA